MLNFKSDLAIQITKALTADERTQNSAIEVVDNNGVVTLSGTAPSDEQRSAAEEIARSQDGVVSVISDMKLEPSATSMWPLS